MKKVLISVLLVFSIISNVCGSEKERYIGVNIGPSILSHEVSIIYEKDLNSYITAYSSGGVVFNAMMGSMLKCWDGYTFDLKSGGALKTGIKAHFNSKFTPFIGVYLVNSLSYEKGFFEDILNEIDSTPFKQLGYNLGVAGTIGLSTQFGKRIKVDVGVQSGGLIIDNLRSIQSYAPGMGIDFGKINLQWVLELSYRLGR